MNIPFIKEAEIEAQANALLNRTSLSVNTSIPIEEILECHMKLVLEPFDDALFPEQAHDQVLGYTDLRSNIVGVHESIIPRSDDDPNIGRYNFTLAHEIGHHILHKDYILQHDLQLNCFEERQNAVMHKSSQKKSSHEWQADCFASYLLMPKFLIIEHLLSFQGHCEAVTYDEIAEGFADHVRTLYSKEVLAKMHFKQMARALRVSQEALYIRLKKMRFIAEHKQYAMRL
jgi:IrrE N-terminal-like domain